MVQLLWKTLKGFLKQLNKELVCNPAILHPGGYQEKLKPKSTQILDLAVLPKRKLSHTKTYR